MARSKHERYSEKTINEAIALYQSGEDVSEINRTYNLTPTTIYHFLKSRGIPTRQQVGKNGHSEPEVPGSNFTHGVTDLVVTTDNQGFVQSAKRKITSKFELVFTGRLIIEEESLEAAIGNARKRMFVERIHSIKEML